VQISLKLRDSDIQFIDYLGQGQQPMVDTHYGGLKEVLAVLLALGLGESPGRVVTEIAGDPEYVVALLLLREFPLVGAAWRVRGRARLRGLRPERG
jgi:hypothetical protein